MPVLSPDFWVFILSGGAIITSPFWLPLGFHLFVRVLKKMTRQEIVISYRVRRRQKN